MSNLKIVIVDYGLGNMFSIQRAISYLGKGSLITGIHKDILNADRIILPGVGSFGESINVLKKKGLDEVLLECADSGKLILGVCLGMQLLFSISEEFGKHEGLNLIPGEVMRFPKSPSRGPYYKIPHVGWNKIFPKDKGVKSDTWSKTILQNNLPGDYFYFVHSYRVIPEDKKHILAITEYGGIEFCSVVKKKNVLGCQFHPELSGKSGLMIYHEFLCGDLNDNLFETNSGIHADYPGKINNPVKII